MLTRPSTLNLDDPTTHIDDNYQQLTLSPDKVEKNTSMTLNWTREQNRFNADVVGEFDMLAAQVHKLQDVVMPLTSMAEYMMKHHPSIVEEWTTVSLVARRLTEGLKHGNNG